MVAAQLQKPQEQEAKPWKLDISPKQLEIMQACREKNGKRKYIFVNGPKWTGKTMGCLEALVDHAWNTKDASISVIAESIGSGAGAGIWNKLTEKTIPRWISGNFGFDWWRGEDGQSKKIGARLSGEKKNFCEILNKYGGKSRFELDSLKDERNVEQFFFNRYFSMVYWSEAHNSRDRKTFITLYNSLRAEGLNDEDMVLLLDGNPSDEGKNSWLYKVFFEERIADDLPEDKKAIQQNLKLIIINLDDNPYLSDQRKKEIANDYAYNPDLHARYYLGEWTTASEGGLFSDIFVPAVHVLGDVKEKDPETPMPSSECVELFTGWDLGGRNPSAHIMEKIFERESPTSEKIVSKFVYLDELVYIGKDVAIGEFTEKFLLDKVLFWERIIGHPIKWTHWSDSNAFDHKEPISKQYYHQEVFAVSMGKIRLKSVIDYKGRDSIRLRVRLWRKMLIHQRIKISGVLCPKLVEMCQMIQKGLEPESISAHSEHKHPFDSATYPMIAECWDELRESVLTTRKLSHAKSDSGLVCVKF